MIANNTFILSGKYQVVRCLGEGTTGVVYLARHHSLECEYAIKQIPKNSEFVLCALSEAKLLRSLRHPAIPVMYGVEEDESFFYLVEEYVCGESLDHFLLHQKKISQIQLFQICEQLCELFVYLHNRIPSPILYQDLKPAHIFLCGPTLKVIDFGCAFRLGENGNPIKYFGNTAFSAPETFGESPLMPTADVYSLGKLFLSLAEYLREPLSRNIYQIFQKATETKPELRYPTVDAFWKDLENEKKNMGKPHLLQNIAVVGCTPGCGTTHIAIALVSTLNSLGIPSYYRECGISQCLHSIAEEWKEFRETTDGAYVCRNFKGYPNYGPGIYVPYPDQELAICDYGCSDSLDQLDRSDLILCIAADALWLRKDAREKIRRMMCHTSGQWILLCNPGHKSSCLSLAKEFHIPVLQYYPDPDPFRVDSAKERLVRQLLKQKGREFLSFNVKKRFPHLRLR